MISVRLHFIDFIDKQLVDAKNPNDKTKIQHEVEATDHQIDQLVYELYGLRRREIAKEKQSQLA